MAKITKYRMVEPAKVVKIPFNDQSLKNWDIWFWILDPEKHYVVSFLDSPDQFAPNKMSRKILPGGKVWTEMFIDFFPTAEFTHWPVLWEVFEIDG